MRRPFAGCLALAALLSVVGLSEHSLARDNQRPAPKETSPKSESPRAPSVIPRFALRRGGRRIESGLRVETTTSGVLVAEGTFPPGGEPQGMPLPEHLGGGYLFYQSLAADGSSATAFFRSETWTGVMRPLARVPFPVRHVSAGFDRIYVLGVTLQMALDPDTGDGLSLAPLPPLVTLEGLAFEGSRRGIVSGPLAGVFYTRDAGVSWMPLPTASNALVNLSGTELLVETEDGVAVVNERGDLRLGGGRQRGLQLDRLLSGHRTPTKTPLGDDGRALNAPVHFNRGDQRERAWTAVLTRGIQLGTEAVALADGALLRMKLDPSLDLSVHPAPVSATSECIGTKAPVDGPELVSPGVQSSALFVCQGSTTQVYRWVAAKGGRLKLAFEGGRLRRVLSWGSGGVLLEGSCQTSRKKEPRKVCFVGAQGAQTHQLPQQLSPRNSQVAYAVSASRAWVLWVDEKAAGIRAFRLGSKVRKAWALPSDHAVSDFLRAGAILPRASIIGDELSLWATQREKLVGVRLGDGEEPSFGAVQRPLSRALLDGPRALIWGAAGFAKQSVDGGQVFTEIALPYRSGDPELSTVTGARSAVVMGCSEVGCALGRLLKLGWDAREQSAPELPPLATFWHGGGSRFRFTCGAGDLRTAPRRSEGDSSFPHFWEEAAPARERGMDGSSIGFPGGMTRLYAWGPADMSWGRTGSTQVYFIDPWDPKRVHKTAATRHLFSSSLDARAGLGLADRATGFNYQQLDPSGRAGVMVLRSSSTTDILTFAEGKPLERFGGAHDQGLRDLAGAVLSRGSLVAAFRQGPRLAIARLVGGAADVFARLPLGEGGERGVDLVRTHGGALGIAIEGDAGLFVYPLSDRGELGDAIVVPHFAGRPPACAPEASGFIVDKELVVAPYFEASDESPLAINRVYARLIVGHGGACLEGMMGQIRGALFVPRAAKGTADVPLSVLDSDSKGNRTVLMCE